MGAYHVGTLGLSEYSKTMAIYYSISRVDNSIFLIFCICLKSWIWNFHEELPVHEKKSWLPLDSQRTKFKFYFRITERLFQRKTCRWHLIAKARPALHGQISLKEWIALSRHLLIPYHMEFIHLVTFVTDWLLFIFLNVLFYIGVNKAYVLLVPSDNILRFFMQTGNKLRRQRILRLASNHPKWNSGCEMMILSLSGDVITFYSWEIRLKCASLLLPVTFNSYLNLLLLCSRFSIKY